MLCRLADIKTHRVNNEGGDSFINAAVAKAAKQLKQAAKTNGGFNEHGDSEHSYQAKILQVDGLINEDKALKKAIKADTDALHLKTKRTIESLSDEQACDLLHAKWITPLLHELSQLPSQLIFRLTSQVHALAEKYATTYADVAKDITQSEQALAGLLGELTANEFDQQGLDELQRFLLGE